MKQLVQALIESRVNTKNIRKKIKQHVAELDLSELHEDLVRDITEFLTTHMDETYEAILQMFTIGDIADKVLLAVAYAAEEPKPIQAIGAILGQELCIKHPFEAIYTATELLNAGCECGLYDIHMRPNAIKIEACFDLPEQLLKDIDQAQYPTPMICPPRKVDGANNLDTSHITRVSHLILGKVGHHNEHLCVDSINYFNSIPLSLDEEILACEESFSKPLDTREKREQFQKMAADSNEAYNMMLIDGNRFWLTHKYDYRGRTYSQGYHINIQSTEYKKALISFANREVME